MKRIIIICALTILSCPQAEAMNDDDMIEAEISTDATKTEYAAEDDETIADIQQSDEDLAGFVHDYVRKDSALKGSFLIEDSSGGKILKLNLDTVAKRSSPGPDNSKTIEAVFKNSAGQKHTVLFHIRAAGFGGIDISKIELKKEEKVKSQPKNNKENKPNKGT